MANKKPRTPPPPPRKVQAPQQRRGDDMGRQHRTALYGLSGAGILGLIVVVVAIAAFGKGGSNKVNDAEVKSTMATAGCTFKTVNAYVPAGQGTHVPSLTAKLPWNTNPPSNGQHYPEWAVWGFYTSPINPRMVVHNEEHGGVVVWWGSQVSAKTVQQLKAWYDEEPTGSFGTPYPQLGKKIAITAWTGDPNRYQRNGYYGLGHIGTCPSYTAATKKAFEAFRKAYRGKGPEGIPLSADKPGLGP